MKNSSKTTETTSCLRLHTLTFSFSLFLFMILFDLSLVLCLEYEYQQENLPQHHTHTNTNHQHQQHHHHHKKRRICSDDWNKSSPRRCGGGKECIWGRCVCRRQCPEESESPASKKRNPICWLGSDGLVYKSHCDVRRAVCLSKAKSHRLFVNHSSDCLHFLDKTLNQIPLQPVDLPVPDQPEPDGSFNLQNDYKEKDKDKEQMQIQSDQPSQQPHQQKLIDCSLQEFEVFRSKLFGLTEEKLRFLLGQPEAKDNSKKESDDEKGYGNGSGGGWDTLLGDGPEADKDLLIRYIFTWIDRNSNFLLDYPELYQADLTNVSGSLNSKCQFRDFLLFGDSNFDGSIHVTEFYSGFSHLYGVTMISLEKSLELRSVSVSVGESVSLSCDVMGSPPTPILWLKRLKSQHLSPLITNEHIRLSVDGTLHIHNVGINDQGNYSCQSVRNEEVIQVHMLQVKVGGKAEITPKVVIEYPGTKTTFECLLITEGGLRITKPLWKWFHNNVKITSEDKDKENYLLETLEDGRSRCTILSARTMDTGTFNCEAETYSSSNVSDTATLIVLNHEHPWLDIG